MYECVSLYPNAIVVPIVDFISIDSNFAKNEIILKLIFFTALRFRISNSSGCFLRRTTIVSQSTSGYHWLIQSSIFAFLSFLQS